MLTYQEITIPLPDDYEGKVIATLISAKTSLLSNKAILYIHGYVDYFFQDHMAAHFIAEGYNFYALELRKYGRSILSHQHPFYVRNLYEYYAEMDRALEIIQKEGNTFIGLIGHSTGGSLAALYMNDGKMKEAVNRVILNSPFLEFNTSGFKRNIAIPITSIFGQLFPYSHKKNEISPFYTESVHKSMRGEWDFDLNLKPKEGVPLYFAWLRAIRQGHKRIKRGLYIKVPVQVMHSDRSVWGKEWNEDFTQKDGVLNVADIRKYAPRLGNQLSLVEVPGGMHDLVLSRPKVRAKVLSLMSEFMNKG